MVVFLRIKFDVLKQLLLDFEMAYLRNKIFQPVIGLFFLILSVQVCATTYTAEEWEKVIETIFPRWYFKDVPEYCDELPRNQKKCSNGDMLACYYVGFALKPQLFKNAFDGSQLYASRCPNINVICNRNRAIEIFKKVCESGDGDGCFEVAQLLLPPFGMRTEYTEGALFHEKGCEAEIKAVGSCHQAGKLYRDGKHVKQDFKRARKFFTKGCDANDSESCLNLADMLEKGQGFFFKSKSDAKELYGKLCDKGNLKGCENFKRLNQ